MGNADWARRIGYGLVTPDGNIHHEDETGNREHDDIAKDLGFRDTDHAVNSGAVRYTRLLGGLDIEVSSHARGAVSRAGEFIAKHGQGKHIFVSIKDSKVPNGERSEHSPNTSDHRELVASLMKHEETKADVLISMLLEHIRPVNEISIGGILGRVANKSRDILSKAQETVRRNVDDFNAEMRKNSQRPAPPSPPPSRKATPTPTKREIPTPSSKDTPTPVKRETPASPTTKDTPAPPPRREPPAPTNGETPTTNHDGKVTSDGGEYTFVHTPIKDVKTGEVTHHKIVSFSDRKIVNLKVGDSHIPFYCSTGENKKDGVTPGKWYPMLGLTPEWINKTNGKGDMQDYYGHPELKRMSEFLDSKLGDVRDGNNSPNKDHPLLQSSPSRQDGVSPQDHAVSSYDHINHPFGGTKGVYTRLPSAKRAQLEKEKGSAYDAEIKNRRDTLAKNKSRLAELAGKAQKEREGRGSAKPTSTHETNPTKPSPVPSSPPHSNAPPTTTPPPLPKGGNPFENDEGHILKGNHLGIHPARLKEIAKGSTNQTVVRTLSQHTDPAIRAAAASNPQAHADDLRRHLGSGDKGEAEAAAGNPALKPHLDGVIRDIGSKVQKGHGTLGLMRRPDLTPEQHMDLHQSHWRSHPESMSIQASNPNLDVKTGQGIARRASTRVDQAGKTTQNQEEGSKVHGLLRAHPSLGKHPDVLRTIKNLSN